jgi:hypothetical protein
MSNDLLEHSDRESTQESLASCRDSLESLQNLRYLISMDNPDPMQQGLYLRMMDTHLNHLSDVLLRYY